MPSMRIKKLKVDKLSADPRNARTHNARNLKAIKASLEKFGQQKPIVINAEGIVIAGNGTLLAAIELGWKEISAVETDLEGVNADAFALADNRSSELANWNYPVLGEKFKELMLEKFDMADLGWQDHEIQPLLEAEWQPPSIETLEPDEEFLRMGSPLKLTKEQREVIDRAIESIRQGEEDKEMSEGRCIELICADWLAG